MLQAWVRSENEDFGFYFDFDFANRDLRLCGLMGGASKLLRI